MASDIKAIQIVCLGTWVDLIIKLPPMENGSLEPGQAGIAARVVR